MKKVFAFDMGKASIGFCVREDEKIKNLGSVIIEKDHSDITDNRNRRRVKRTLNSHRAREKWFKDFWESFGLVALDSNDEKFKREFAFKGDDTIYNSTLLRIALIQGRKLEDWQIYKALHSAIQRRGYDINIPWANDTNDEKENEEAVKKYCSIDGVDIIGDEKYKYPCYYDAVYLDLWQENKPDELKKSIGLNPKKVRTAGRVAPRELVEKELRKLWQEAKKQLSELEDADENEFLYGEHKEPYASFSNPKFIKHRGTNQDLQGVLGQKIPRFDNRIIAKCRLLPKRNVCSSDTIENISLVLLMQLKNFRFVDPYNDNKQRALSALEIKKIYENKLPNWIENLNNKRKDKTKNPTFTITKTDIEKVTGKKSINTKMEAFKVNTSGRSSFCRRAAQIMIDIILSGKNPDEIDVSKYIDKEGSKNGITQDEIKSMLSKIGSWENLYISDNRDEMAKNSNNPDIKSDILIGNITNPVVRNRLQIFKNLLNTLIEKEGKPDEVIFEFVRDGADNSLFGKVKADNYIKHQKNQEKEDEQIKKELLEAQNYSKTNFTKWKLAKMQDFKCIYSGQKIGISNLNNCQIDHIFPRSQGGNDALYNKVICYNKENQDKKDRTPYEWLFCDKQRWAEYIERVSNLKEKLGKKKTALLILPAEKCIELIDSYNGLAETAQVAKIASAITHFTCGWGMQTKDDKRHVFVENGSTTAKIRRIHNLNKLLGDDEKKNRSNPKHHALDAICISYAKDFKFNEQKRKFCIENFNSVHIEQKINELMPYPYTNKKPLKSNTNPLETIYGKRIINNKAYITSRADIATIKKDLKSIKNIIDEVIKEDLTSKINLSDEQWQDMLKNYTHPKKQTKVKKVLTIVSEGILEKDKNNRERIGEFVDFGTKGTMGQFKHSKGHKGQILYYDNKNNIKVMPIYSNKSTKEVKDRLIEMNCKLYQKGEMFYSGCLVEIPNDFKAGSVSCPKGVYKLRSLKSNGVVKLENNIGQEISTSAKNLVLAEFKKLKD